MWSAQPCGLENRVCNLVRRERIHGDGDVGGAVEREAAVVAVGQVGLVGEDGAGVLRAGAAGQGGGQLHFQMDQQRAGVSEQQRASLGALDGAAAKGQNQRVRGGQAGYGRVFAVAEPCFAMAGEEFGDGGAGFLLRSRRPRR